MNQIKIEDGKIGHGVLSSWPVPGKGNENKRRITFIHPIENKVEVGDEISSRLNKQIGEVWHGLVVEEVHETRLAKGAWPDITEHPTFFDVTCRIAPIKI
jgi:hypothetical protein